VDSVQIGSTWPFRHSVPQPASTAASGSLHDAFGGAERLQDCAAWSSCVIASYTAASSAVKRSFVTLLRHLLRDTGALFRATPASNRDALTAPNKERLRSAVAERAADCSKSRAGIDKVRCAATSRRLSDGCRPPGDASSAAPASAHGCGSLHTQDAPRASRAPRIELQSGYRRSSQARTLGV
jgi:hypothetical protein